MSVSLSERQQLADSGRRRRRAASGSAPARELAESLLLFALTASTLGAYVGMAMLAVRMLAAE